MLNEQELIMEINSIILDIIDDLDGWGLVSTDDELQAERLLAWGKHSKLRRIIVENTPPEV